MSPLRTISVKLDDELERKLLNIASARQEMHGERVTLSDVIRDLLQIGSYNVDGFGIMIDKDEVPATPMGSSEGYMIDICEPYEPVGRKLLLPIGRGVNEYEPVRRSVATKPYVIPKRGSVPYHYLDKDVVPDMFVEGEDLVIPVFEIATHPMWHLRDGLDREEEIIQRAKDSVMRQEDAEIFKVISNAVPAAHSLCVVDAVEPGNLEVACRLIWEHEVKVETVACHPTKLPHVNDWVKAEREKAESWPNEQSIEDVQILSSTMCPADTVFVLGPADMVGRVRVWIDLNVLPADELKKMRYGRLVWESIGLCVVNDYCTSKIIIV